MSPLPQSLPSTTPRSTSDSLAPATSYEHICDGQPALPLPIPCTPIQALGPTVGTPGADGESGQLSSLPSCIPAPPVPGLPETSLARTLVLCFDGTGDQFDADNSNVVQFFSMLKKDDRKQQMVYYQAGIGTYTAPSVATPSTFKVSKILDEAIAWNLHNHVKDGYEFLMQNYEAGDKICIFGFSRGAYTARALAGMIHKVGLLPASNHQQVPFAYRMYKDSSRLGWSQSTAFKRTFSMDVDVEFIGVWDTVSSVGLIGKRLPFTTSNTCVRYFRHAVSLDERRAKFRHNSWNYPSAQEQELGVQEGEMPKAGVDIQHSSSAKPAKKSTSNHKRVEVKVEINPERSPEQHEMEQRFSRMEPQPQKETDVLEVWFAGCHCDVGGGSVPNDTPHNLARIPLRWMIRQCFLANTGIRFHTELLRTVGLDPDSLYPIVKPRPPPIYASPSPAVNKAKEKTKAAWRMATLKFSPLIKASLSSQSGLGGNKLKKRASVNHSVREKTHGKDTRATGLGVLSPSTSGSLKSSGSGIKQVVDGDPPDKVLSEEEEDLEDVLSPVYDQLSKKKWWWILELLPVRHRVQQEDTSWKREITMNLGKGRKATQHGRPHINIHRSVKIRMDAHASQIAGSEGKKYLPKANLEGINPTWVD